MNRYKIHGLTYQIHGESLEDAIVTHFEKLARDTGVGNAAGYKLVRVVLAPGAENSKIGGKPYAVLLIDAQGYDLVHERADGRTRRTTIYFECQHIEMDRELHIKAAR